MRQLAESPTPVARFSIEPKKKIRFAEQKIRLDFFGRTPIRPGRNLTRTFPKIKPKFGLQSLPIFRKEQRDHKYRISRNSVSLHKPDDPGL